MLAIKEVTQSIFEIGIIVASFSFAQILSEIYFGRISDKKGKRLLFITKIIEIPACWKKVAPLM